MYVDNNLRGLSEVFSPEQYDTWTGNNYMLPGYGATPLPTANSFSNAPANNPANAPGNTLAAKLGLPAQIFGLPTNTVLIGALIALVALYVVTKENRRV